MFEELLAVLRRVLSLLADTVSTVSGFVADLVSTAPALLEGLAGAIGHEEGLFLPAGRGASILVLGGIVMVAFSLSIALAIRPAKLKGSKPKGRTARAGPGANGAGAPWARFSAAHADPTPAPPWLAGVRRVAAQNDLGEVVLLSTGSGRRAVAISACSGSPARKGVPRCHHARKLIRAGLRTVDPQGRVVAVSCTTQGGQACVFEIRTGGTLP